MTEDSLSEFQN